MTITPTKKAVEVMTMAAIAQDSGPIGSTLFNVHWAEFGDGYREVAEASLTALISLYPGIASVIDGTGVVVPRYDWQKAYDDLQGKIAAAEKKKPYDTD